MRPAHFTALALGCLLAALAAAPACSSSSSGSTTTGAGGPPPGDSSKRLQDMSASDASAYCADAVKWESAQISETDAKSAACNFGAALQASFAMPAPTTDAQLQSACKSAYDSCMAKPAETSDAGAGKDPCAGFADKAKGCNGLTVGEYNACLQEDVTFFKTLADPTLCSKATLSKGDSGTSTSSEGPACKNVDMKCPGLHSSASGG